MIVIYSLTGLLKAQKWRKSLNLKKWPLPDSNKAHRHINAYMVKNWTLQLKKVFFAIFVPCWRTTRRDTLNLSYVGVFDDGLSKNNEIGTRRNPTIKKREFFQLFTFWLHTSMGENYVFSIYQRSHARSKNLGMYG